MPRRRASGSFSRDGPLDEPDQPRVLSARLYDRALAGVERRALGAWRDPGRSSGRTRWRRRTRGLRENTADAVADEAAFRVGQALWWVVTYPFRFLIKAFTRGFDIT